MEDLTTKIKNSISAAQDLPEVPRDEAGKIIIESIAIGKDEKNNNIIPDNIFNNYYKELPVGCINESKTWRTTSTGGKIKILGGDPEGDRAIQIKGAETLNATNAHRRSIKEILEELSKKTVTAEEAEEYGLKEGTTLLEAANLAQIRRAMKGDTKAAEYVRDTLGEKPSEKIDASIMNVTPEDQELIKRVASRLPENIQP